jgi:hypothetical protein
VAKSRGKLGPHSRTLCRGAIGASIDGRSREGRFLRMYEAELIVHVGGAPSTTQRILITRASRLALRLELLDERALVGLSTEHDLRLYSSLNNHLRLVMRELGLKPSLPPPPSLADLVRHEVAA